MRVVKLMLACKTTHDCSGGQPASVVLFSPSRNDRFIVFSKQTLGLGIMRPTLEILPLPRRLERGPCSRRTQIWTRQLGATRNFRESHCRPARR